MNSQAPRHSPVQPRQFRRQRILRIQLDTYYRAVEVLADAARRRHSPITATIGIANGGLAPAQGVSELLHVPTYRVNAKHNPTDATYSEATGVVTYDLDPLTRELAGHRLTGKVLVVDDICGTGATFTTLLPELTAYLGPEVALRTVALCRNAGSVLNPDLWIWTVDDWVSFPWEQPPAADAPIEDLPIPSRVQTP
ncbi:phosphoribosyltransferase family protein [Micromonospora sp. WMMD718]|uniref:phosphoribosyltransferase n=1 Tax=Micromonospora TaxID=1873 RepID=UPI00064C17D0|nr:MULTISPECIES: phosphoribosyltransferase family protein [unclassified Micromonospora]MDG4751312.1 phosphoribosyltransferase family protein [Micromonospora sp. WMMD718]